MNIFSSLFRQTLIYKIFNSIANTYIYIRDYHRISKVLYGEDFKLVLKKYLHVDFETDWLGRLWGVMNPMIDINGKFNLNNTIMEIDGNNTNNSDQIQYWAFKQLKLVNELFKIENLYNYIDLEITHIGPITADNYLIVFDMVSRKLFAKSIKNMLIHLSIYTIIALILFMTIL